MDIQNSTGFELLDKSPDMPSEADYCLTLTDETMEPYFPCGSMVYITSKRLPEEFQAGVFFCGDKVVCRQWCEDYSGALHLLCHNRRCADLDISFPSDGKEKCLCMGSVISSVLLPPPEL